ncbi:hypothetical protein Tco_0037316, partial [Tanacetum coccineum]
MLTEGIKQSETYHTFIKYFTGLIPLKKSIGKGSQGKKSVVTPKSASVEVSDESDPELARRQTGNRRKSKKKFSILADDNIILEPYVTLKLGKSMSLIEAEEEEAARQVHATHERLVTESDPKPARRSTRRRPSDIAFRDTLSVSKKKSPDQSQKLKGVSHKLEDQVKELVFHQWFSMSQQSSSQPQVKELGSEEESEYSKEETVDEEIEWLTTYEEEEKKDDDEDDRSIDIEKTDDDKETYDEFVHGNEYVHDDVDEEMKDAEVTKTGKDGEEITDVEKTDAEKTEATKGDLEQAGKLPLISSSLSVSSGFGNQFLNLSPNTSLNGTTKESPDTEI